MIRATNVKFLAPAIHIATAGVAIGLAVMIVSVCVVLGFKHTIRDKVIGFWKPYPGGRLPDTATAEPIPGGDERLNGERPEEDTRRQTRAAICHERRHSQD